MGHNSLNDDWGEGECQGDDGMNRLIIRPEIRAALLVLCSNTIVYGRLDLSVPRRLEVQVQSRVIKTRLSN